MGSLAAILLYFFIKGSPFLMGVSIFICVVLGFLTTGRAERLFGRKDASEIIIDEFAGMLLSLYLLPATVGYIAAAFLMFRFFDIVKPKPINRLEKLEGGIGVMADDLMAGLYTNVILQIIHRIF
ncbi:phosphatidylglycerophosphatase A [Candidatus Omnitrophota bacterium]